MMFPPSATLTEVGPRDGFQFEEKLIPADLKVETIDALVDAGIRSIQITSFVHPGRVPQMADAEEVCRRVQKRPGVVFSALVLNPKGLERAARSGLTHVDLSISTSDTHSRRNANMSLTEAVEHMREMIAEARQQGLMVRAGLQCVFGCAYEGPVPVDRVLRMAEGILASGVSAISLADSTGMATPLQIQEVLQQIHSLSGGTPVVLHLHDTRGLGLPNVMTALQWGVTHFDSALAGMGGCPFIPGATGNIATEDTVYLLQSLGVQTGIDIGKVAACSRRLEEFLKKRFPGKMHHRVANER